MQTTHYTLHTKHRTLSTKTPCALVTTKLLTMFSQVTDHSGRAGINIGDYCVDVFIMTCQTHTLVPQIRMEDQGWITIPFVDRSRFCIDLRKA